MPLFVALSCFAEECAAGRMAGKEEDEVERKEGWRMQEKTRRMENEQRGGRKQGKKEVGWLGRERTRLEVKVRD